MSRSIWENLKEVLKSQENVGDAKIYSAVSNKLKIFNV